LIILGDHRRGKDRAAGPVLRFSGAALVLAALLGAAGCTQTTTQTLSTTPPAATAEGPLVLNSAVPAGGTATASAATPDQVPSAATSPPQATTTAPPPAPVAAAAPAPAPAPTQPTATISASSDASEPLPTSAPAAPAKDSSGYPNINVPPQQPGGQLLPAEERARIIAELEKLRDKQGEAAGTTGATSAGGGGDLARQGETHGQAAIQQIERCSEEGAAEKYPECGPAD
jgi:hypothetical protein